MTVSADGTVSAGEKEGSAEITVTGEKDGRTARTTLTVHHISADSKTSFPGDLSRRTVTALLTLKNGGLVYSVSRGSAAVVNESAVGVKGTGFDFTSGLVFKEKTEVKEVHDTYKNYSGSYAEGHDDYREQTVTFTKGSLSFSLILRAYDDGFAFRFRMEGQEKFTVTRELSEFSLPAGSTLYGMKIGSTANKFNGENGYPSQKLSATSGQHFGLPLLAQNGDLYTLITESDIWTEDPVYYGNSLVSNGSKLTTEPAPIAKSSVTVNGPFLSPWQLRRGGRY